MSLILSTDAGEAGSRVSQANDPPLERYRLASGNALLAMNVFATDIRHPSLANSLSADQFVDGTATATSPLQS